MRFVKPGEVWIVDLGLAAKIRPCLILTPLPKDNELDVFTVVAHTTALRGNYWELSIPKSFLRDDGGFDVQRIITVASVKLERKLGTLSKDEFEAVLHRLAERLGL